MSVKRELSVTECNIVLRELGCKNSVRVVGVTLPPEPDRSPEARRARRREYDGLRGLPFMSEEQVRRMRALESEVVADNHAAFEEDKRRRRSAVNEP